MSIIIYYKHTAYVAIFVWRMAYQQHTPYTQNDQDADLEEVFAGAKRLNQNARAINGEVVSQNRLIDDLAVDVEKGTTDMAAQTAKAEIVNKQKSKVGSATTIKSSHVLYPSYARCTLRSRF
ncbi:unnamed protein product [Aphanomyces euteiches]